MLKAVPVRTHHVTNPSIRRAGGLVRCLLCGLLLGRVAMTSASADEITRTVQEELRKRNLYFGDVDGRLSPQVAAALRRYQQRKGFQPTGEADNITLCSLNLSPPLPAVVTLSPASPATVALAGPSPAAATPLPALSSPWPDLPVLHSDEARVNPLPATDPDPVLDPDPTPRPAPRPPPAAASLRWPSQETVHKFIADCLQAGESNVPGIQTNFYADHVDYFNEGVVNRHFVDQDTARYNKRWPDRHFTLLDPIAMEASPDRDPAKVAVIFHCRIDVRRPGHDVQGETENTYLLQRSGLESLRIVSIKEERIRGK